MQFEYKVKYSDRKTLSILIKNSAVIVSAPLGMPLTEIERYLINKNDWILKKLNEQRAVGEQFSDFFSLKLLPYHGERFKYEFISNIKSVRITDGVIQFPIKPNKTREQTIIDWYKRTAKSELSLRLEFQAKRCDLSYSKFRLTNAKSKWGSCDSRQVVSLNWRLIMYSPIIIDYVIIHELCHTLHMNHSKQFWAEVGKRALHVNECKRYLKSYGQLINMFR